MTRLINSVATSAYRIMTGVKRLDKVRNSVCVVLDSVSRNDLIHTFLSRQLCFLGHLLRSDHTLYGKTRCARPRTNYITYIQKITGHQLSELIRVSAEHRRLASTYGRGCWPTATRLEEEALHSIVQCTETRDCVDFNVPLKTHMHNRSLWRWVLPVAGTNITITSCAILFPYTIITNLHGQLTMALVAESWAKSLSSKALLTGAKTVSFWSLGRSLVVPWGTRNRSPTLPGAASIVPENSLQAVNSLSVRLCHLPKISIIDGIKSNQKLLLYFKSLFH